MPGFIGFIGKNISKFNKEKRNHLMQEKISGSQYCVERRSVNKFLNDKVFVDRDELLIVTEGVILNSRELITQYNAANLEECIATMYKTNGKTFFNEFRGSFSGLLYDKKKDVWLIYTDHIGDKQVFYSEIEGGLLFGSEMEFLVETLKSNDIPITISKTGAYLLLTHGFMIEDHTLVNEVKRLAPGHYLSFDHSGLREIQYHRFSNKPKTDMSIEEAVEGIDKLFRQAVKRQFEKDKEYGYKHITTLSGGLDSRMTVWVAHQMGYTKQLNTTFSQSNYLDFTIAQQIATDLQHEFLFKALDYGNFLRNVDDVTRLTYGNGSFFGLSHGKSMYDLLNFESYGIMHTGMIGDAIIGTFFKKPEYNREVKIGKGAYSLDFIERLADYKFKYEYENEEIFCLYTRAFTGANEGMVVFQEHTESVSPFCDVDFLEFCYSIPLKLRFNHKIYFDWILDKYPGAAEYLWEKIKSKIHKIENEEPKYMNLLGHKVPAINDKMFLIWIKGAVLRKLGLRKKGEVYKNDLSSKDDMNPIEYWFATNKDLAQFINGYLITGINQLPYSDVKDDCITINQSRDKSLGMQVLSLVSAIKLINKNKDEE